MAHVDVKLTDTAEAFDLPEWPSLVDADPHRHIFATPVWHRLWWDEFGEGKKLFVLTFLDPGPVGIAALMLDRREDGGRFRFVGGDDLTDYLGPVSAGDEHHPAIAETLLTYLRDEIPGWSWFEARCLPVPFRFADWLVESADRLGLKFSLDQEEVTAVLELPESFEEYVESLPPKKRHELRRKLRRFEREAPDWKVVSAIEGNITVDLLEFIGMHRGSGGLKGKFMAPERATFFGRVAEALYPLGWLRLDFLQARGERIAASFSFEFDGTFYLYNSAFEQSARDLSPGLVLAARLIEGSISGRLGRFDFLRGRERYKFDLGAQPLPLHTVRIERRGPD